MVGVATGGFFWLYLYSYALGVCGMGVVVWIERKILEKKKERTAT